VFGSKVAQSEIAFDAKQKVTGSKITASPDVADELCNAAMQIVAGNIGNVQAAAGLGGAYVDADIRSRPVVGWHYGRSVEDRGDACNEKFFRPTPPKSKIDPKEANRSTFRPPNLVAKIPRPKRDITSLGVGSTRCIAKKSACGKPATPPQKAAAKRAVVLLPNAFRLLVSHRQSAD
jgi:hypothetical protein